MGQNGHLRWDQAVGEGKVSGRLMGGLRWERGWEKEKWKGRKEDAG